MSIKILSKPFLVAATAGVVASGLGAYIWHQQHRLPILEMYVFALKSGRSMFIRTPNDQRILVDGGGNSQVVQQLTDIIPFYSRRINTIIVTNTDGKNVSGLIDVINRYVVDKVYVPKFTLSGLGVASSTDKIYETFLETVKQKKIQIKEISAPNELVLGQNASNSSVSDVIAHIFFPAAPELFDYSKASAPELLFNISYGDTSSIFMGDASKKVQKFVASSSSSVIADADVLIVSHSAVALNMSPEFMNVARPNLLIYEKVVTKSSSSNQKVTLTKTQTKSSSSKIKTAKKIVADPLAAILDENRFDLKEVGTVKVISDGKEVVIGGK